MALYRIIDIVRNSLIPGFLVRLANAHPLSGEEFHLELYFVLFGIPFGLFCLLEILCRKTIEAKGGHAVPFPPKTRMILSLLCSLVVVFILVWAQNTFQEQINSLTHSIITLFH